MPLETVDQQPPPSATAAAAAARLHHPTEPENFPCPRCDSTNTKFCYYNNYNLSQPRYFCKSCRRYWTRGGTLRNVPFGGATRKNPLKRSRSSSSPAAPATGATTTVVPDNTDNSNTVTLIPPQSLSFYSDMNMDGNYQYDSVPTIPATFTSLLSPHEEGSGGGLFGLGLESESGSGGIREMEFGLSIGIWPMEEICDGGGAGSGAAWQMGGGGDKGLTDSECFDWPELAISTPGKVMK